MDEIPLGAQISHMLKDRGVEVIFGIPGVHNIEMYRGIEDAGITHVLARHEQGAGFMADGYARASRKPGVAYVITGPGLCNIMTPMGQAYSDSVSMLVLSSCLDETAYRKGQLHQMKDQEGAAACVCDWSETATTPEAAYGLINKAMREFFCGDPRPKHIQVPISALGSPAPPPTRYPAGDARKFPDPTMVKLTAHLFKEANKPLLILGGGAKELRGASLEPGQTEFLDFLDQIRPATFTTGAGRGIVPIGYDLNFGSTLANPDTAATIGEADLVLVIGSELAEVDLWREHLGHTANMIRVDVRNETLNGAGAAFLNINAGAFSFIEALRAELGDHVGESQWSASKVSEMRKKWRADTDAARPGIVPIVEALAASMPDDTMYFSDMTQFAYVAKEVWDMNRPGHWHHPFGFGTLGYALPAAIGGAIARPGLPTLAIAGDYGFQYSLQELGVAVELGLSLPILLWDNCKLKEIEDSMIRSQIAPNAVTARNPDFLALARAYGAKACEPTNVEALVKEVNSAFSAGVPTLIRVTPAINIK